MVWGWAVVIRDAIGGKTFLWPPPALRPSMAAGVPTFKAKVCLIGEEAVGKSSLIRRFATNEFAGEYIRTLGTQITKKEVNFQLAPNRMIHIDFTIWDIMGQKGFMDLVGEAYFYKAGGVFAVCDLTNSHSFYALKDWLLGVRKVAGAIPTVIAANKADVKNRVAVTLHELEDMGREMDMPCFQTSAKTGEGVAEAFQNLARRMLEYKGLLMPA